MKPLGDEVKTRIELEETYRLEVQRRLNPPEKKSRWSKIFESFNSPIVLWLVGTVGAGIIVSKYQDQEQARKSSEETQYKINRLDAEISNKLTPFYTEVMLATNLDALEEGATALFATDMLLPEHKGQNILGLMVDLRFLLGYSNDDLFREQISKDPFQTNGVTAKAAKGRSVDAAYLFLLKVVQPFAKTAAAHETNTDVKIFQRTQSYWLQSMTHDGLLNQRSWIKTYQTFEGGGI